jgi:serine/threonine protein kinase
VTDENWQAAWQLYSNYQALPPAERDALLSSANADPEVIEEVVALLDQPDDSAPEPGYEQRTLLLSFGMSRYAIRESLGVGGTGEVYSAEDRQLGRTVALKFLRPERISTLSAERLILEARTLSGLNHPNIVTVHEVIQSPPRLAIVMEFVEGASLRRLCGKPLPLERLADLGQQIAQALATAHARGIVHGDIKPENIVVRPDGYLKVLDFGLARQLAADDHAFSYGLTAGTLRYMSPEQLRGEPLTPASDIFSFGLLLYELATGRHPFPDNLPFETALAILTKEPGQVSATSGSMLARLDSLLRRMLAKNVSARPSAEEVAKRLAELRVPRATSSNWKVVLAAAAVAAISFGTWWLRPSGTDPSFRQITTFVPENRATAAAISPDGTTAAYANIDGVFVQAMRTGETKALRTPPDYVIDQLAWFSDRTTLVASGFSVANNNPSIWLISRTGASPHLLRAGARHASPSPDGRQIAFLTPDQAEIWVIEANGRNLRRIVASSGDKIEFVLWSPDGRRLMFQRRHYLGEALILTYESVSVATGRILATGPDLGMSSVSALPDGRLIFLRWDSQNFTSSGQLWEVRTSLETGALRGSARKIASIVGDGTTLSSLTVTADGRQALVLRTSDQNSVFVGRFNPSGPAITDIRRLTLDERTNYPHAWTADSRAVIFESDRSGNFDLFKQDIDRRTPEKLVATPFTEILPQLAPGGEFVLYAARPLESERPWYYKPHSYKLMRVPVAGGTAAEVPIGGPLDEFRCPIGSAKGCVLRTRLPGGYFGYYDLDPIKGKGRELARTKASPAILGDWDVSPDGTQVAIPNHDLRDARIRLVDLRPAGRKDVQEGVVVLAGLANLNGLVWSADGKGWFVTVNTSVGNRMVYAYLDGRYRSLGDVAGWAVPSPDGRQVAFLNRSIASNVWLIERRK